MSGALIRSRFVLYYCVALDCRWAGHKALAAEESGGLIFGVKATLERETCGVFRRVLLLVLKKAVLAFCLLG